MTLKLIEHSNRAFSIQNSINHSQDILWTQWEHKREILKACSKVQQIILKASILEQASDELALTSLILNDFVLETDASKPQQGFEAISSQRTRHQLMLVVLCHLVRNSHYYCHSTPSLSHSFLFFKHLAVLQSLMNKESKRCPESQNVIAQQRESIERLKLWCVLTKSASLLTKTNSFSFLITETIDFGPKGDPINDSEVSLKLCACIAVVDCAFLNLYLRVSLHVYIRNRSVLQVNVTLVKPFKSCIGIVGHVRGKYFSAVQCNLYE